MQRLLVALVAPPPGQRNLSLCVEQLGGHRLAGDIRTPGGPLRQWKMASHLMTSRFLLADCAFNGPSLLLYADMAAPN